jgi:hypothetical protein
MIKKAYFKRSPLQANNGNGQRHFLWLIISNHDGVVPVDHILMTRSDRLYTPLIALQISIENDVDSVYYYLYTAIGSHTVLEVQLLLHVDFALYRIIPH